MDSTLAVYDALSVYQSFAGRVLYGFSGTDIVTVEQQSDLFGDDVGFDGAVARIKMNDRRATVTLTVTQTSKVNDMLSAIIRSDHASKNGVGVGPYELRDGNGTTRLYSPRAWLMALPVVAYSASELKTREWRIRLAYADGVVGGNFEAVGGA